MRLKISILLLIACLGMMAQRYKSIEVTGVPFTMQPIREYVYPDRNFSITKYGARKDGKTLCTKAIEAIDTDVLYQWRNLPDYDTVYTTIDGIHLSQLKCDSVQIAIDLNGDDNLPIRNVSIEDIHVGTVTKYATNINNAENVSIKKAPFVTERDGVLKTTF